MIKLDLDTPIQHIENPTMKPELQAEISNKLLHYYGIRLPKTFSFIEGDALQNIFNLTEQKGFNLPDKARNFFTNRFKAGITGDLWNFIFTTDEYACETERDLRRLFLANGAFIIYANCPSLKKKTACCWVKPYGQGYVFFEGDRITARKCCRLVSDWSGVPHVVNLPYIQHGAEFEIKREAVHYIGPDADSISVIEFDFLPVEEAPKKKSRS